MLKYVENKIDFADEDKHLRSVEKWLPSIPLGPNTFSDTGYRFRRNLFELNDKWTPGSMSSDLEFFDVTHYNTDVFVDD